MPRTVAEKVSPSKAALVVIDMQNDFCHENGTSGARGFDAAHVQAIIPNLQRLLRQAREVSIPIIFARVSLTDDTVSEVFRERSEGKPYPCREGTWGAEWAGVSPEPGDRIISKQRFSMFTRTDTDFDAVLRELGVESLILTGTRTNVCVECTARDGYQNDYYIVVLSDCTAASDPQVHEDALDRLRKTFAVVTSSEEVMQAWDELKAVAVV
jgi:ureidoacrylate peracid hydrolase